MNNLSKTKTFIADEDMAKEIKTLYVDEGMSAPKIAERLQCSSLTVLNILRSQGVQIRSRGTYPKKIKTDVQMESIFEEYQNGKSLSTIAAEHKVNPNTIYYHMKKHNRETRTNRKLSKEDISYIQQKCQGNPNRELVDALAKKFNITPNAIRYHVKKARSIR